ncbi:MAG TPA: uroporphyrinogen-III synthase [Vitreimonas sp.]|uniref:uroporphyrinogen-III synthase n=1 Tax=Vitreimonas sp. TaxID=3069702 RepID=UPI002D5D2299|nr:uroporphyrinogen-III synthase [Vitreimonas sp.]HYD89767.1 uroporphyrinogen-III synthase [Vitreimonas sp.]
MRVAITRALPEATRTAERLRALGAEPVLAPLLTIAPCAFDANVEGAQALIFTSTNGVRTFAAVSPLRSLPVFAVGDATAAAAREAGFADARSADGNVSDLAVLIKRACDPIKGKLIHIGGAHLAGDLAGELVASGYAVERRIAYEAVAASALPAAFAAALDAVLFHSARAAETFVALGAPGAAELVAACISEAAADPLRKTAWKRIIVAPAPREDALLSALLQN